MTSEPISAGRTTVLIVDDDPDISQTLVDLLEHEGYQVHLAGNGRETLEKTKQHHYGAVILDLGLPDMDGLDLLKTLLEIDANLPIIVLTAYTTSDKTVGALSQGAFAFLTKPYNRDQLKATLSRAVGVKALTTRAETIESELTASEDRFRSIVQSATDGIIIAGGLGQIISWNKAAQRIFGYTDQEVVGKSLTMIMPERHRKAHQDGLNRFRSGGQARVIGETLHLEGLRKDGTEFPIELSIAAWTRGLEIYYCGIVRDVTEYKQTQAALRASEERFRSLVSNIPGAIYRCACDPNWAMEFLSDAVEDVCGYPASEFIANRIRSYASIIHPDDRVIVEQMVFGAVSAKRPFAMEYRVLHADGTIRWVYEKGRAIIGPGGRVLCLDGVIFDVTDRKHAEEALQESEERLRLTLTTGYLGTWDWNISTGAVVWSENVEAIFGLPPGSFAGTYQAFLDRVHQQDRHLITQAISQAVEKGAEYDIEHRIVRPDETFHWVSCHGRVLRDDTGAAVRMLGTIQLITERKQAEEALVEQLRLATFNTDLGIVLTQSHTLRDMLGRCTDTIVHHLDAAFARIWLLNPEGTVLELQASSGMYTHMDGPHSRVPIGSLKIGRIAQTGQPHVTNDVLSDPQISDRAWAERERMVAFAGYPLIVEHRLIGVLAIFARRSLTDYATTALASAGNAIAGAIERKQAEDTLRRKLEFEKMVVDVSARFMQLSNFDQAVSTSLCDIGRWSGAGRAYLFLLRDQGAVMDNTHEWCVDGVSPEISRLQNLPSSTFPWLIEKLRAGESIHIEDISTLPPEASAERQEFEREAIKSLLLLPVRIEADLMGFLGCDNVVSPGAWREENILLLRMVAEIIGNTLQRKQAVEALERSNRHQELILHSAGEGIYGLDLQGRTTFVNEAAARMLGWEVHELLDRSIHSLHHHTHADGSPYPSEQCPIYAAFKDGSVRSVSDEVFWRKDGTSFPVEYVSTPIRESGKLVGAVVVFRDMTDRKVTEDALRESEQLLRQVTENIREVFWVSDLEKTRILYISPAYEEIWGRSCESLLAAPRSWLEAIHSDDRDRVFRAALTQQVSGGYREEYRIVRPDGSLRLIRDRAFPVRDATGRIYRIAGIAEDITTHRQED